MSSRTNQKVVWADKDFVKRLEMIQAKKLLNGNPIKNLGQLTKQILECPSFKQLEQELENLNLNNILGIKLDKKRGLK